MSATDTEFREKVVGRAVDAMAEVGRERAMDIVCALCDTVAASAFYNMTKSPNDFAAVARLSAEFHKMVGE